MNVGYTPGGPTVFTAGDEEADVCGNARVVDVPAILPGEGERLTDVT